MTDTIGINQSEHKRRTADKRLARSLLFLGLIIPPAAYGISGLLGVPEDWPEDRSFASNLFMWISLASLVVGLCCCVASAFFTLYPLSKRLLLALVAAGLFAVDVFISLAATIWIFGWD